MSEKLCVKYDNVTIDAPRPAIFERRVKTPPAEAELVEAIRSKKLKDPAAAQKIEDILRRATKEIEAI